MIIRWMGGFEWGVGGWMGERVEDSCGWGVAWGRF